MKFPFTLSRSLFSVHSRKKCRNIFFYKKSIWKILRIETPLPYLGRCGFHKKYVEYAVCSLQILVKYNWRINLFISFTFTYISSQFGHLPRNCWFNGVRNSQSFQNWSRTRRRYFTRGGKICCLLFEMWAVHLTPYACTLLVLVN